ncbi:hypothetical protein NPIL_17401 [Nephila pilipes]|uniref:Uncharacterized protein n=1 Tax=Nephila pilipes TaxID=299642 RepID=A0A8X6MY08_NEPPI|nr:hypothetical protein NPIL_17401 [Nephila pilipes]
MKCCNNLEILQIGLFPQLLEEKTNFVFQRDGDPAQRCLYVRVYFNGKSFRDGGFLVRHLDHYHQGHHPKDLRQRDFFAGLRQDNCSGTTDNERLQELSDDMQH